MKLKIMYFDKQLQEIRSQAKNCMMELGPLELEDPSDLYPLVRLASNESADFRFTKSVVLATQEFNIESKPELLPTIHLYGPENLGNYEIIHCHPVIRPRSGMGIETLQKPEINLNEKSNFDDIARISESYEEYLVYLNVLEFPSTIDHICLILSTRYQHKFNELYKYIYLEEKFSKTEYDDLHANRPELPSIRKAVEIEKEVEEVRNKVYEVVEQSVNQLKKDNLVVTQGKKILPNADSLMIKTNCGLQEIEMPSIETIRKRGKSI